LNTAHEIGYVASCVILLVLKIHAHFQMRKNLRNNSRSDIFRNKTSQREEA